MRRSHIDIILTGKEIFTPDKSKAVRHNLQNSIRFDTAVKLLEIRLSLFISGLILTPRLILGSLLVITSGLALAALLVVSPGLALAALLVVSPGLIITALLVVSPGLVIAALLVVTPGLVIAALLVVASRLIITFTAVVPVTVRITSRRFFSLFFPGIFFQNTRFFIDRLRRLLVCFFLFRRRQRLRRNNIVYAASFCPGCIHAGQIFVCCFSTGYFTQPVYNFCFFKGGYTFKPLCLCQFPKLCQRKGLQFFSHTTLLTLFSFNFVLGIIKK